MRLTPDDIPHRSKGAAAIEKSGNHSRAVEAAQSVSHAQNHAQIRVAISFAEFQPALAKDFVDRASQFVGIENGVTTLRAVPS